MEMAHHQLSLFSSFSPISRMENRNWCFTSNNPDAQLLECLAALTPELNRHVKYMIFGKEVAPTTGTPHLQGYIVFNVVKSLKSVAKLLPRSHLVIAEGDAEQNFAYCSKDGDFVEVGVRPMSKKRKAELCGQATIDKWADAKLCAEEGRLDDVPAELLIKYRSTLLKMRKQAPPPSLEGDLQNIWIFGPAGSGKSRMAHDEHPGAYLKCVNKWWDGYDGQSTVIVDDMDPFHKSLALEFKMWGQHQPFSAETKGGTLCIRPKKIVVTSNYSIDEVWEEQSTRAAMHRRYREVYKSDLPRPVYEIIS